MTQSNELYNIFSGHKMTKVHILGAIVFAFSAQLSFANVDSTALSLSSDSQTNRSLVAHSRKRRYLLFPEGSTFTVFIILNCGLGLQQRNLSKREQKVIMDSCEDNKFLCWHIDQHGQVLSGAPSVNQVRSFSYLLLPSPASRMWASASFRHIPSVHGSALKNAHYFFISNLRSLGNCFRLWITLHHFFFYKESQLFDNHVPIFFVIPSRRWMFKQYCWNSCKPGFRLIGN